MTTEPIAFTDRPTVFTALCLWEATLEMQREGEDFPLFQFQRRHGRVATRDAVIEAAHHAEDLWAECSELWEDTEWFSFDFDWCPECVRRCFDSHGLWDAKAAKAWVEEVRNCAESGDESPAA